MYLAQFVLHPRIEFILADAYIWLKEYQGEKFDLIFADAMPGKYDLFDEAIQLLKSGGMYVIDDMLPQPNWPAGHAEKADTFYTNAGVERKILFLQN